MHTNYDRDEDGEPGFAEEEEIERFADYMAELSPAERKQALRAKALRDFEEAYDADHADDVEVSAEEEEARGYSEEERRRFDKEDRAVRRAEGGW